MASKVYRLLSIFDASDWVGRQQGGHDGSDVYTARADTLDQLQALLDRLLKEGVTFKNAIFTTHGGPGRIWFGDDALSPYVLFTRFNAGHYERLFPFPKTRMYFDGCNVAESDDGWLFLEAAARTFLRGTGGMTFGWTSMGIGMPSWLPFIGGHTEHLTGRVRYVILTPAQDGGAHLLRYPTDEELARRAEDRRQKIFEHMSMLY